MSRPRLLFFDLLRILCIIAIVLSHICLSKELPSWIFPQINLLGYYSWSIGELGVFLLILLSGAVLEYQHSKITSYPGFLLKRIARLYPLYWISLIIGTILLSGAAISIWENNWLGLILATCGKINPMAWFISLMICLYALFPILSKFIEKYGICAIITIFLVSNFARDLLGLSGYYSPIVRLFEFSLGIWIIKIGFFPSWQSTSIISWISDLTFPVFIIHSIILSLAFSLGLLAYSIILIFLSIWLWYLDRTMQAALAQPLRQLSTFIESRRTF